MRLQYLSAAILLFAGLLPFLAAADDLMPMPDPSLPPPTGAETTRVDLPAAESNPDPNPSSPPTEASRTREELPISTRSSDIVDAHLAHEERTHQSESVRDKEELAMHEDGHYQFALDGALKAFSSYDFDTTANNNSLSTNGVLLSFLYFPLVRTLGRLGIGPVVGIYKTDGDTTISIKSPSFLSFGAELQYAAQYAVGQVIVPYALMGYANVQRKAYVFHASSTSSTNITSEQFDRTYMGGGLQICLNRAERRVAARALAETGIKKYYITASWQQPVTKGRNGNALLGLRFEF